MADNVNHPSHYTDCSLECIEVMGLIFSTDQIYSFCLINAFKYLWRYRHKNGFEDLKKAEWCLNYAYVLTGGGDVRYDTLRELLDKVLAGELTVEGADKV